MSREKRIDLAVFLQYTANMKAKAKPTGRVLEKPLQVRVSPEQYALYIRAAVKDGRSLSNWARDRLSKCAEGELGQGKGKKIADFN